MNMIQYFFLSKKYCFYNYQNFLHIAEACYHNDLPNDQVPVAPHPVDTATALTVGVE